MRLLEKWREVISWTQLSANNVHEYWVCVQFILTDEDKIVLLQGGECTSKKPLKVFSWLLR